MASIKDKLTKFGNVVAGSEVLDYDNIQWLDTGSYTLNKAINPSGKGIPVSYVVEFFGDYSSGKSLLSLHCLKSAQQQDGVGILIDTEGSFDRKLASDIGLNLDELAIFKPTVEDKDGDLHGITYNEVEDRIIESLNVIRKEWGADKIGCIVWDSLASTNSERDNDEKKDQGANAKEIKAVIKRFRPIVNATNTGVIIINQIYDNISIVPTAEPTKSTGGRGTAFQSHIRIEFIAKRGKAGKVFDDDENIIGTRLYFKVNKNRISGPFQEGYMDFLFGEDGKPYIDYYSGYMDYLIEHKKVDSTTKKGYILVGEDKYRRSEIDKMLKDHPELL